MYLILLLLYLGTPLSAVDYFEQGKRFTEEQKKKTSISPQEKETFRKNSYAQLHNSCGSKFCKRIRREHYPKMHYKGNYAG